MSRYLFISLLLLAWSSMTKAQTTTINKQGLSLGIDLSPFIIRLFDDERTGFAFNGRYSLKEKWFMAGEAGFENTKFSKREFDYETNGTFIKAGLDYNLFSVEEADNNDNVLIGLRYGYAWQEHTSDRFTIIDDYWGSYEGSLGTSNVNSHWMEIVFGLRSEVLKNFYMGWTIRLRQLFVADHTGTLEPYTIPGFGKFDNKTNLGFTYTLEYQIPIRGYKNKSKGK